MYIALAVFFGGTLLAAWVARALFRRGRRLAGTGGLGVLWLLLLIGGVALYAWGDLVLASVCVLLAVLVGVMGASRDAESAPEDGA